MDLFVIDAHGTANVELNAEEFEEKIAEIEAEGPENNSEHTDSDSENDESESDDVQSIAKGDDEDDDCIVVPRGSDDEDEEPDFVSSIIPKVKHLKVTSTGKKKKKKNEFDLSDVYLDHNNRATAALKEARKKELDKRLEEKSLAMKPGLEKLESVPNPNLSDRVLRKQRKLEREKTKGANWFNMPATEVTEEVKRDLEVLQMRSVLDPKTFYKKNDLKVLPKYFQVGRVADNAADFYHSRIPKKERKRTMVDELLADAEFQQRSKKKFKEIIAEKEQVKSKAHRQAHRLKKRKK